MNALAPIRRLASMQWSLDTAIGDRMGREGWCNG